MLCSALVCSYLAALPRELREELWKFVHYIHRDENTIEAGITKRFHNSSPTHYCMGKITLVPPPEPVWFMGSRPTWSREQFLYYSRDGTAVIVYYKHPIDNVYYTSIETL